ncbi:MAG: FKBP-type peptidyl-prolyl cis-trans isomerase [Gammaproteobacteria bacterium]|nr:FKBP-type peptidyl-prolyl cis-trans isomerase [Gammaproteobacteria bacterium]
MSVIEKDKVITVTYRVEAEGGEVIEQIDLPVNYVHGRDSGLVKKVEQALDGCSVGDEIEVKLSPAEGFGEWNPELTFSDVIENVPPHYRQMGAEAEFVDEKGETLKMVVTHIDNGTITLDGNHPFAGKNIIFIVKVLEVRDATREELINGVQRIPGSTLH